MKLRIIQILLIFSTCNAFSQSKKIEFNLSLGPTFSLPKTTNLIDTNITTPPTTKTTTTIGAYILPSINYSLNHKFSIDFGLGYYLDRFSVVTNIGDTTNKANRNMSQIQTPLNVNFHFGKRNAYQLGVGAFSNFIIAVKEKGTTTTTPVNGILNNSDTPIFTNNATTKTTNNSLENYNRFSVGTFIQLKRNFNITSHKQAFVLLKINQYINTAKKPSARFNKEQNATTINIGFGITL